MKRIWDYDEDKALLRWPPPSLEFTDSDIWRVFRIQSEIVAGFEQLSRVGPACALFGSARTPADHRHYALARETARQLAGNGMAVITGGGPGRERTFHRLQH